VEIQRRVEGFRSSKAVPSESHLVAWFRRASRPKLAYGLLCFVAVGYSAGVSYLLSVAHAHPMPEPYLRIPDSSYFYWGTFFYGPVIVGAWLLAGGLMYLVARAFRSRPNFDELLRRIALASGIGTLATLLPDLVTSPLRALGVIDEQAWESSILRHGGWFFFLWAAMTVYVGLFLVLYPLAVRQTSRLPWSKAIATGVIGFLAFQGFEYVFIR
jgi:hypothetical protein